MNNIKFYRGLKSSYDASVHSNIIYFTTDTQEIIVNGKSYSGNIESISYDDGTITITLANGELQTVNIPLVSQTTNGLMSKEDKIKFDSLPLEELLCYGVEWDINVSDPHITRIGNMSLHKTLPIQSQLKGCIAQSGKIIYWLDENDWKWRKSPVTQSMTLDVTDGVYTITNSIFSTQQYDKAWLRIEEVEFQVSSIDTATTTAILATEGTINAGAYTVELGAVLNGYDGTVRVYCPSFYIKSVIDGDKRRVWLSTVKIDDTWTHQPEILIDAYRCTLLKTVPENMGYLSTLSANSAISVVNTNTYCRGGNNRIDYDKYLTGEGSTPIDIFRTDLGKPRASLSRTTMRIYARATSSHLLSYDQYKNIFYWLYVIEYANFNSQEQYNEELTSEGYYQGGMGPSITNVNAIKYNEYNGRCPITPCGYGNDLGNRTGLKTIVLPATSSNPESTHYMARWRGFDNPFGDTWTNLDGIIIDADADNHPNNMNYVYTCQKPFKYADNLNGDGYEKVGEECHQIGYIKLFDLGDAAHIITNVIGGGATQYKCDNHNISVKNTILRTFIVGGSASDGVYAGLSDCSTQHSAADLWFNVCFRSISLPKLIA